MIEQTLKNENIDFNIRQNKRGEPYAGFNVFFGPEEVCFTAMLRNDQLRIFIHQVIETPASYQLFEYINLYNEKWVIGKFYYNHETGWVEASSTFNDSNTGTPDGQIWSRLHNLHSNLIHFRISFAQLLQGELDSMNAGFNYFSGFDDPSALLLREDSLLAQIEKKLRDSGLNPINKFDGHLVGALLSYENGEKTILDFFVKDLFLVCRSYTDRTIAQDSSYIFLDRMQYFNLINDMGTIGFIPEENRYYFFQAYPILFLNLDLPFIRDCIQQNLTTHSMISKNN